MIYVHDTIKFRSLVKLPISFQIYKDMHTKYIKINDYLILSITIYSPEIIIIYRIQTIKYSKYLIKLKRKIIETREPTRWNIIKVEKLNKKNMKLNYKLYLTMNQTLY